MAYRLVSLVILNLLVSSTDACMAVNPGGPGMPATPSCQKCDQALITKTTTGNGAKPFASDVTTVVGGCSQRTLTCTGMMATIEVNAGNDGTLGDDATPGMVTINPTCNADGTAWVYMGIPITQLECAAAGGTPACQMCNGALITLTTAGNGAKLFAMDNTAVVNGCTVRTLVCTGLNANVEINAGEGVITDADQNTPGTVTLMPTCNAAGTAWEMQGIVVTQLECAAAN